MKSPRDLDQLYGYPQIGERHMSIQDNIDRMEEEQAQARFDAWWVMWKPVVYTVLAALAVLITAIVLSAGMALAEYVQPGAFMLEGW